MSRREVRKEAFKLLFASNFNANFNTSTNNNINNIKNKFVKDILDGVNKNIIIIDDLIKRNIRNWKFERVSRIAKSAMRMATYEIIKEDLPIAIIINEAVEIAKIFGSEEEANYVQGVLTSISSFYKEYIQESNLIIK